MGKYSKSYIGVTYNDGNSVVVDGGDKTGFLYLKCKKCEKDFELNGDAIYHVEVGQLKRGHVPCSCSSRPNYNERQMSIIINRYILQNNLNVEFVRFIFNTKSLFDSKVVLKCLLSNFEFTVSSVKSFLRGAGNFVTSVHRGRGLLTLGKYPTSVNGKQSKEYSLWTGMLARVYSGKHRSYDDCAVSENFLNFQYFAEWCQDQFGFGLDGYELDKDLLFKGNKIYSEDTCVFIPRELNRALPLQKFARGDNPLGVSIVSGNIHRPFLATLTKTGYSSCHETAEEAFVAYKNVKEDYMRSLAVKYKGVVDNRVIVALESYKVDIKD